MYTTLVEKSSSDSSKPFEVEKKRQGHLISLSLTLNLSRDSWFVILGIGG
jgi:hypothetical protein